MTRLSHSLIRANNVGVGHDERKVTRERHARIPGYDRELWRRRHLYLVKKENIPPVSHLSFFFFSLFFLRAEDEEEEEEEEEDSRSLEMF